MSTLHALLLFVGGPALLIAIITLLVMAPSLANGPRYRPGLAWGAEPEWFGGPETERTDLDSAAPRPAIEGGVAPAENKTGGASANW